MPLFTGVTLKDSAAANVVCSATQKNADGTFLARNSIAIAAFATRTAMRTTSNTVSDKSVMKITVPIVRPIDGVDTVVENVIIDISARVPKIVTQAERDNALAFAKSAYTDPALATFFNGSQGLW